MAVSARHLTHAAASIIFPFGLGAVFSLWWKDINNENNGSDWVNPDITAFILFCGTCLSFTAFPVLCSILKSAHMIKTPLGALVSHPCCCCCRC